MKNIHLLPTDKGQIITKTNKGTFLFCSEVGKDFIETRKGYSGFHLYITSEQAIKEGDFSFYSPFGVGKNIVIDGELCFHIESKNGKGSFTQRTYQTLDSNKKIILTTDPDLIKDGVQDIGGDFLEWFVENANESGVPSERCEVIPSEFLADKVIYEITITD
jgi:hypothetical protein